MELKEWQERITTEGVPRKKMDQRSKIMVRGGNDAIGKGKSLSSFRLGY